MATLDLTPERVDIPLTRKDSFSFEFLVEEEDSGDPIDFTGTTVLLTANTKRDGSGADLFAISPTNTLDDTGLLQFKPTAVQTDHPVGAYYYDVEWTYGSSVRTIINGTLSIKPDISN